MATEKFAQALRRVGGMWGSAWEDGRMLTDVVQVTATQAVNRIDIPLVGTDRTGYKRGRHTQEGSIVFQKVDTGWELRVYNFMMQDVEELRAARDAGAYTDTDPGFNLLLKQDDPHAYAKEVWQVTGCMIWQMEIGINSTDDFIQRDIPMTFDKGEPLRTFKVVDGVVVPVHTLGV